MDVSHYRDTGEYSDLTIRVDGKEFALHKFPIFLKCDHLRRKNQDIVEFNHFPGGPFIFSLVADFCYGKCVVFTLANIIGLRCAAELLEMHGDQNLGNLADDYIDDMLESALKARTMSHVIEMISQCVEIGMLASKVKATDRCFLTILEMYPIPCDPRSGMLIAPGYDDQSTIELVIDKLEKLPLEQLVCLIRLCGDKKHLWTALSHIVHDFLYRIFKVHQKRISDDIGHVGDKKEGLKTIDLSKMETFSGDDTTKSQSSLGDTSKSGKKGGKKKKKGKKGTDESSVSSNLSDKSSASKKGDKKGKKKKGGKDKSGKDKSEKGKSKDKSGKEKSKDKSEKGKSKDKSSKEKSSKDKSEKGKSKDKSGKDKPSKGKSKDKGSKDKSASLKSETASGKTSPKPKKGKGKNKSNSVLSDDEHNASALDSIDNLNSYFTFKQSSNLSNKINNSRSISPNKTSQNNNVADKSGDIIPNNDGNGCFESFAEYGRFKGDTIDKRISVIKNADSLSQKSKSDKMALFKRLLERKPVKGNDSVSDTISDTRSMPIWKCSKDLLSTASHKTWNTDNSCRKINQLTSFQEEKTIIEDVIFEDKMKSAATSPLCGLHLEANKIAATPKEDGESKITTEVFMKKNYEMLKSILENLQKDKDSGVEAMVEKSIKGKKLKSNVNSNTNSTEYNKNSFLNAIKESSLKTEIFLKSNSKNSNDKESFKKPTPRKCLSEDFHSCDSSRNKLKNSLRPQKTANMGECKSVHPQHKGERDSFKSLSGNFLSSSNKTIAQSIQDSLHSKKLPASNTKSECLITHGLNRKPSNSGCNPDYTVLGSSECICSVLEKRQKKLNKLQKSFESIQNKREMLKDLCQKNSPLKKRIYQQKQEYERDGSNNANDSGRQNNLYENSISPTNPSCSASLSTSINLETYIIQNDSDSENECSEIQWQYNYVNTNQNNISEHLRHIKKGSCRLVQVPINSKIATSDNNSVFYSKSYSNEFTDPSTNASNVFKTSKPTAGAILDAVLKALPDRKLLNHLMSGEWLKMALITAHRYQCDCWDMLLDTAGELLFEFNMNELRSLPIDLLVQIIKRALGMNKTNPKAFVLMYSRFMDEVIMRGNVSPEDYIKLVEAVPVLLQPHPDRMYIYAEKLLGRVLDDEMRRRILATVDMSRCSENVLRQAVHRSYLNGQQLYAARKAGDNVQTQSTFSSKKEDRSNPTILKTNSSNSEVGSIGNNASSNNVHDWKMKYGEYGEKYQQQEKLFNEGVLNRLRMAKSRPEKYPDQKLARLGNEKLDDLLSYNVNQKHHLPRRYPSTGNISENYNFNANYRGRNSSTHNSSGRDYQQKMWNQGMESKGYFRGNDEAVSYYDKHPPNYKQRYQFNKPRSEENLFPMNKVRSEDFSYQMSKPRIDDHYKRMGTNDFSFKYGSGLKMPISSRSKSPISSITDYTHTSSNPHHSRRMPYNQTYSKYRNPEFIY